MQTYDYEDGLLVCGDNLEYLRTLPNNSVDLVFGSPPYEAQRTYRELQFNLKGADWVRWMVERWVEMQRVCRGLVAMVVEGYTEDFEWSASPAMLMVALKDRGLKLRKPPIYRRYGVPGNGGLDYVRNDYEFVVVTSKGKLPWSDNTAMGKSPKFGPGGDCTNRDKAGDRVHLTHKNNDGTRKSQQ